MVDSQGGNDGAGGPKAANDPLLAFVAALRDMWSLGSFATESVLTQRDPGAGADPFTPFVEPLLRAAAAFRDIAEAGVGAIGGGDALRSAATAKPAAIASLVAQAYLVAAVSGLRYWRRVAQTYGAHQSGILQSLLAKVADPNMSEEERRTVIDEIRAYLREVGDLSLQEARVFQAELEKLAVEVADTAEKEERSSQHRRRWKAKP